MIVHVRLPRLGHVRGQRERHSRHEAAAEKPECAKRVKH